MLLLVSFALAQPAYDLLKLRDGFDCAELGEATPALRDELLALTAPDVLPSSVPMRAASCLAQRFTDDETAQAAFVSWAADPERPGEAMLVLAREAQLPEAVAVELVKAALSGPNARVRVRARTVARVSVRPAVQALTK